MSPQTPLPSLTAIVATTPTLGIGYMGSLPWPAIKPDLAFFARVTKRPPPPPPQSPPPLRQKENEKASSYTLAGQITHPACINALLMGRKTWASIPASHRPLGDRVNVIITRQPSALAAEFERTGPGKSRGADGKQHVLIAGSIEEGLRRLRREYPPLPHHHQSQSEDGEGADSDGVLRETAIEAHHNEKEALSAHPPRPALGRIFVIGGAEIYARALELDLCERVLRTHLKREWKCETWFPPGILAGDGDTNEQAGSWERSSDEDLDAWCGESVAGEQSYELADGTLRWEVEMWERRRAR